MSEFEDRIRDALAVAPEEPDEAFTNAVVSRIAASEKLRARLLVLATMAAVGLGTALLAGLAMLAPAWNALAGDRFVSMDGGVVKTTVPVALFLFAVALLSPLIRSQR